MKIKYSILSFLYVLSVLSINGCATSGSSLQFSDLLSRYPDTKQPLSIQKLSESALGRIPARSASDIVIMVHPAYSLFFRSSERNSYSPTKYNLLKHQFEQEARFIAEASQAGKALILIIPGNYSSESIAPGSYTAYLNSVAASGTSVLYLSSEEWNKGGLAMQDMVMLYRFLQRIKAGRVMIGGGYIGRCQREFHTQFTTFFDKSQTYIVPEISTISPDDISESEAAATLASLGRQDYTPIRRFASKKAYTDLNLLSIPQRREF